MKPGIKKIYALIALILVAAMLLTSCTGSDKSEKDNSSDQPASSEWGLEDLESATDIAYVLVYNPDMYYEKSDDNESLFSGDFGTQIIVDTNRAGENLQQPIINTIPQDLLSGKMPGVNPDMDRSRDMFEPYDVGDTVSFYASIPKTDGERVLTEFTCIATGKYANAWVCEDSDDLSESAAEKVIKNFDETIYSKDTKLFGEARFAENGHKVNILFHEMPQGHLGYFHMLDLFSKRDGVSSKEVKEYGVNLDHAIIHVNSEIASRDAYREVLNSTIAHEFQHLICFSSAAENGFKSMPATWLNESMSGYIEESIYPGIQKKNGRYDNLSQSDLIRHGQSLYNFKTKTSFSPFDIGVYGSVFLFSEYLANKAGKDVFKTIHDSYRDADGSLLEATAIKNAVSSSVKKQIENSISYPKGFVKMSKDEVWLSKLTLDFYLSMLNYGSKDPKVFKSLTAQALLYDDLDGADIEGGGRVLLATKKGKFKIPKDADKGLIYIGLDKDFNVITDPTFR